MSPIKKTRKKADTAKEVPATLAHGETPASKVSAVSPIPPIYEKSLDPLQKLSKDLKQSATMLRTEEARYLVDMYYTVQEDRIRSANRVRAFSEDQEPHQVILWLADNTSILEEQIKKALDAYSMGQRAGRWARAQHGIGPVIAAGLLAHIDPRSKTAGRVWRFAGLDASVEWLGREKAAELVKSVVNGSKTVTNDHLIELAQRTNRKLENITRLATNEEGKITASTLSAALARIPWNAKLKTLCWKIGESFKKFSNSPDCYYGRIYRERKTLEVSRNNELLFADQAKKKLETCRIQDPATLATYKAGKLPDGRLDLRAARYAVKLFLSHFQQVSYECATGEKPPKPWVIEHGGHTDMIEPPGWPLD